MTYEASQADKPQMSTTHNHLWWTGQVVALGLALSLLWDGYSGPVAAAVGYALAVLVDIREAAQRSAGDA